MPNLLDLLPGDTELLETAVLELSLPQVATALSRLLAVVRCLEGNAEVDDVEFDEACKDAVDSLESAFEIATNRAAL